MDLDRTEVQVEVVPLLFHVWCYGRIINVVFDAEVAEVEHEHIDRFGVTWEKNCWGIQINIQVDTETLSLNFIDLVKRKEECFNCIKDYLSLV